MPKTRLAPTRELFLPEQPRSPLKTDRQNHHSIIILQMARRLLVVFILNILACRPVLAIGWGELLVLMVMAVVLIGPPVYRFFSKLEKTYKQKKK